MSSSVLAPVRIEEKKGGGDGRGQGSHGFGGGDGGGPSGGAPADVSVTGIWVAIMAITMFFAALTSVYIIRRGGTRTWIPTVLPGIVYVNSIILLLSSLTLEFSRAALAAGFSRRFLTWLYVTLGLGLAFIAGQYMAWRDLAREGVYLATFPSSSFFYLLTAAHALHLLGGIIALLFAALYGPKMARGLRSHRLLDVTAIYWHFMYALWIYILLLMVFKV